MPMRWQLGITSNKNLIRRDNNASKRCIFLGGLREVRVIVLPLPLSLAWTGNSPSFIFRYG